MHRDRGRDVDQHLGESGEAVGDVQAVEGRAAVRRARQAATGRRRASDSDRQPGDQLAPELSPPKAATISSDQRADRQDQFRAASVEQNRRHQCALPGAASGMGRSHGLAMPRPARSRAVSCASPAGAARSIRASSSADIVAHRREEAFRIDAHPQHHRGDRRRAAPSRARRDRASRATSALRAVAVSDAAIEIQHVGGAEDDAGRGDRRRPRSMA